VLESAPWLLAGIGALLGLLVGSFLNVVIYRLPVMMDRAWRREYETLMLPATGAGPAAAEPTAVEPFDLIRPRSACPACQVPIRARHNVPVLGWLWLRGRCAACGAAIPARYPVVEAFTGLVSGFLVWHFGLTPDALAALIITWALIALAVIDLDHQLLPDAITLPLLWGGLLFHLVFGPHPASSHLANLTDGVIGAIAGYLSLWLVYQAFRLATGKEGMGYGDFKLFAALGAWLGWQMLPLIIVFAAFTGAVTGIALIALGRHGRQTPIPFGPYLAAAGVVALVWGPGLMGAYLQAASPSGAAG
jgi:leader peptidase (prepilin peptidase)/N-methyltransferase